MAGFKEVFEDACKSHPNLDSKTKSSTPTLRDYAVAEYFYNLGKSTGGKSACDLNFDDECEACQ